MSKKPVKSARATRNEFDRVLKSLEEENAIPTASSDNAVFHVSGVLAAAFPLILYVTKVFDGKVKENIIVYALMVIIAGGALGHSYISLSAKTRKSLLESRDPIEEETRNLKKSIVEEAKYYSLFAVNTTYLAFFMFSIAYILPVYGLSEHVNFSVASLLSGAIVFSLVAIKAL